MRRYRLGRSHRDLSRCLSGLYRLSRRHALSALGLNRLGLYGLARSNRSLSHLRLCRSTRCSGGSSRTALLVKEHATAANRLEAARTLLAALLTVTRGRLRRAGRTGRYGTTCVRRLRCYRCFCLSCFCMGRLCLGCLFRRVHRDVRAARARRLTVHTARRLAGSGLTGCGASLRLFSSFRICTLGSRVFYRLGSVIVSFFAVGLFIRLSVSTLGIFCFCLGAALIAARLDLVRDRLQQTKTAYSPCTAGKNQEENSPTPRQNAKERQKTGHQGKHAQTSRNQQGDTARARGIKVGQRRGLRLLHHRNFIGVGSSRGRITNLRNRSRIRGRLNSILYSMGGTGRSLRKSRRRQRSTRRHRVIGRLVRLRLIQQHASGSENILRGTLGTNQGTLGLHGGTSGRATQAPGHKPQQQNHGQNYQHTRGVQQRHIRSPSIVPLSLDFNHTLIFPMLSISGKNRAGYAHIPQKEYAHYDVVASLHKTHSGPSPSSTPHA